MDLKKIKIDIPEGCNVVLGQTHFIKTAEDIYEVMVNTVPSARFGIAFSEASGPCLIRAEGNDEGLKKTALEISGNIDCGHTFTVVMRDAYPINVLNAIKMCPEVCSIYCATANPIEVVVMETEQGRGIMGVIDGFKSKGVEGETDKSARKELLRKIGYKL
ncbi:MAG: adenosine monophosphate-protein transferase [Deltaproteobacteria bacterium CG12_big_fil_rev_8_21_14_0_65_43_10]|nr:MAG: adenosine monophosphate-protein transferase [Deltaproteobacteria bacterium CG2_30_43_15]PIQ46416.1 MAG: adenosine monophosphate-protein transferase [Deltaproteobacteria bacterium CG12_big_fil_rev_8_21_14_0_65_43_10]PIU85097.1 MAG: adenosine monophosphate-protein transferase [Deltaproteobacteria bacterium CG06_land_8_20_14_3_00_44_19]PIX23342.1 MAG: adenosine monophosphate-protein transferase [Deltaproteobacteria bacterium CG_4_8_14_3_um_filter_43_13]PIZ19093.1 MAG: adenosine monophospha